MRGIILAVSSVASRVTAWPDLGWSWNPLATPAPPVPTSINWGNDWQQPWGYTWETKTWGSVTWTQPAPVATTGTASPSLPTPTELPDGKNGPASPSQSGCMSPAQATQVANNFRDSIALPFDVAVIKSQFAPTFTDYSDSVNVLINGGCPDGPEIMGVPTFTTLEGFIKGQGSQDPIPFTILNMWYTCNTVIIRWHSAPGPGGPVSPQQLITGIIAIEVSPNPVAGAKEPWLIQTVYSEFNSGSWLYDLGVFVPTCPATHPTK